MPDFSIDGDGNLLYDSARLCVPGGEIRRQVLEQAHRSSYSIHPGGVKMYKDLKKEFWWPGMKQDVAKFVSQCVICQQVKAERHRPAGLLHPLPIPRWKWVDVTMDFVTGLPRTVKKNDAVWVIVDRLTKSAHFIPFRVGQSTEVLADKYMKDIVRLHEAPETITSDRDTRFTSHYWQSLMSSLGTKLQFSTSFHPQTDGQSERTIQILEDMLRACILDFGGSWEESLHLAEFAYNNSFQASIGMSPFELLYGRRCRSPLCWDDVGTEVLTGPDLIQQSTDLVRMVRDRLRVAQERQKNWADRKRRHIEFSVGDKVFLKISPSRGIHRCGIRGKLSPRYIGPYPIVERISEVAYRLSLPAELSEMHDVFHVSQLRKYVADPNQISAELVPSVPVEMEDRPVGDQPIRIVDRKEQKLRNKTIPLVRVEWQDGLTWELEEMMRKKYPGLFTP